MPEVAVNYREAWNG